MLDHDLAGPGRIQRQRTKGWRMPEGAVYVGRPSIWGSPFHVPGRAAGRQDGIVYSSHHAGVAVFTRPDAVAAYRDYAARFLATSPEWLGPLRRRDLACWCPLDQPCHADVLLELANA